MNTKVKLITCALLLGISTSVYSQEIVIKTPYGLGGNLGKAYKPNKKVVIGCFQIAQTTTSSASQTAAGGGAYAKMSVSFGGVDPVAYQAIVKEGYDLAVKKLTEAGWEVLTPEQVKATGVETYEGTIAEDKTITYVQAPVTQVTQNWNALGYNSFMARAKELGANLINFTYGGTAVAFDRGSRYSKKASVNASPYLTFGGPMTSYPSIRNGSPATIMAGTKEGETDFVGPEGLYETSSRRSKYLGNAFGKYTLDIDQAKYLAFIRTMLLKSVEQSIETWNTAMNK